MRSQIASRVEVITQLVIRTMDGSFAYAYICAL